MFFSQQNYPLGLDISDLVLRLVQLSGGFKVLKKRTRAKLKTYNTINVPAGYIEGGIIKNPEGVKNLITQLIKKVPQAKIHTREVITALPETKTFIKMFRIPLPIDKNPGGQIKKVAAQYIPFSLAEIYLDWQIISQNDQGYSVLVGAIPKNIADSYIQLLEEAKLIPLVLEIEAVAITRSLLKNAVKSAKATVIVDLGATRTSFILWDKNTIQFSVSIPISGEKTTEAIAEILKVEKTQAEKAKISCSLDPEKCPTNLKPIFEQTIQSLVAQIQRALRFYKNHFAQGNPVEQIILCGGGANTKNIEAILTEKLKVKVVLGNPWTNVEIKELPAKLKQTSLSYTTAIGLALRGLKQF